MLFNSLAFMLIFLPLVLAVALRARRQILLCWLTVASFVFYALAGHLWFLAPMLFTTVFDFFLAPKIAAATGGKRRGLLLLSLCGNLGLLFYFKYVKLMLSAAIKVAGIFGGAAALLSWKEAVSAVILPAGISFYTFQTLSYILDVYRGKAKPETNFWLFSSFVAFFPHLVAGPLTRHDQLIPQLRRIARDGPEPRWSEGLYLFIMGLSKKVLIADRIAYFIDPIIIAPHQMTVVSSWAALVGYAFQIYFDFSGYSDMAIGLGRLFGIELPQNFRSPYQATDPSDFWKRWHITLSTWLRDYLYVSLGGNRCSPMRRNFNLMVTMVLGGLWHGATWAFAAWGFYHGALLILYHRCQPQWDALSLPLRKGLTFILMTVGWLFFRGEYISLISVWGKRLIGFNTAVGLREFFRVPGACPFALLLAVAAIIAWFLPCASSYEGFPRLTPVRQIALGFIGAASIILMNYSSRFLYFQF